MEISVYTLTSLIDLLSLYTILVKNVVGIVRSIRLQSWTLETFFLPPSKRHTTYKRLRLRKKNVLPNVLFEVVLGTQSQKYVHVFPVRGLTPHCQRALRSPSVLDFLPRTPGSQWQVLEFHFGFLFETTQTLNLFGKLLCIVKSLAEIDHQPLKNSQQSSVCVGMNSYFFNVS